MHTDTPEAYELFLYATNDGDLYRQKIMPILENLAKKIKKGKYDKALAVKLWRYVADDAAKKYTFEHVSRHGKQYWQQITGYGIFTVPMRNEVAMLLQENYDEHLHELASGTNIVANAHRKNNPMQTITHKGIYIHISSDKGERETFRIASPINGASKTFYSLQSAKLAANKIAKMIEQGHGIEHPHLYANNPAPRIGTARPKRRSQITKKAPSKRLVARRSVNTRKGYFPNPNLAISEKAKYAVYQSSPKGVEMIAMFTDWKTADATAKLYRHHAQKGVDFHVEAI
jgi:hypothetical protein